MSGFLDAEEKELLRALVCGVRRFAISYMALWFTLTMAFFGLLVMLLGGAK